MNKKKIIQIILVTLFLAIFLIYGWWLPQKETLPYKPAEIPIQGIIIVSENRITNLVYNSSTQNFEVKAMAQFSLINLFPEIKNIPDTIFGSSSPKRVVNLGGYFFVSAAGIGRDNVLGEKVLKLDSNLKEVASKDFKKIGALSTDNKNLFVAADNSFIALDENLNELSRIPLETSFYGEKNAHDILIYKNMAYLLDNIIEPLYLFRVNVEDPRNLQIIEKVEFNDINPHLNGQWLNTELNQWLIIQSYGHRGGGGQRIRIYSIDKGKEEIASQQIFTITARTNQKEGFSISKTTDFSPAWAVIRDPEEKYFLSKITSDNNKISFSNLFRLKELDNYRDIIMKQKDDYLFPGPVSAESFLMVIDTKEPKMIFYRNLPEYDIKTRVIDVLPY